MPTKKRLDSKSAKVAKKDTRPRTITLWMPAEPHLYASPDAKLYGASVGFLPLYRTQAQAEDALGNVPLMQMTFTRKD